MQLLELTDRPGVLGFQADMAHTLLYTLGYNAPEDRILPEDWNWSDAGYARSGARNPHRGTSPLDHRFPHRPE